MSDAPWLPLGEPLGEREPAALSVAVGHAVGALEPLALPVDVELWDAQPLALTDGTGEALRGALALGKEERLSPLADADAVAIEADGEPLPARESVPVGESVGLPVTVGHWEGATEVDGSADALGEEEGVRDATLGVKLAEEVAVPQLLGESEEKVQEGATVAEEQADNVDSAQVATGLMLGEPLGDAVKGLLEALDEGVVLALTFEGDRKVEAEGGAESVAPRVMVSDTLGLGEKVPQKEPAALQEVLPVELGDAAMEWEVVGLTEEVPEPEKRGVCDAQEEGGLL